MTNEIATIEETNELGNFKRDIYSSIKGNDFQTKKDILKAITNCESLADYIGKTVTIKDVVAQEVEMERDGEIKRGVRIVLIDADGVAYACVSSGVKSALDNVFAIMGEPNEWPEPQTFNIVQKKGNNGYKFTTLEIAD